MKRTAHAKGEVRGLAEPHFRHSSKLIMRGAKNNENDDFSDLEFETRSEAGEARRPIF